MADKPFPCPNCLSMGLGQVAMIALDEHRPDDTGQWLTRRHACPRCGKHVFLKIADVWTCEKCSHEHVKWRPYRDPTKIRGQTLGNEGPQPLGGTYL